MPSARNVRWSCTPMSYCLFLPSHVVMEAGQVPRVKGQLAFVGEMDELLLFYLP